jgi:hypothetical protein
MIRASFENRFCNKGTALAGPKNAGRTWGFSPCGTATGIYITISEKRCKNTIKSAMLCGVFLLLAALPAPAQKSSWRQATAAELQSVLPSRAPVESEHIETEMRTASGIVDERGRFIAGVVLITAGYSAEGKYSHYLIVQAPVEIGGVALKPGEYAFGWSREEGGDTLSVHFNQAATGALVGTTDAHRIAGSSRVESLRIWPPEDKSIVQIGRFAIPYKLSEK